MSETAGKKKRRVPRGGPTKAAIKKLRDKLVRMRIALLRSNKELAEEALKGSGQDFSVDHMADHGSDNFDQDFSLSLLEGESEMLQAIDDALAKIDGRGETPFGMCEACADEPQEKCEPCPWIAPGRLEVVPYARHCVPIQEAEEGE